MDLRKDLDQGDITKNQQGSVTCEEAVSEEFSERFQDANVSCDEVQGHDEESATINVSGSSVSGRKCKFQGTWLEDFE